MTVRVWAGNNGKLERQKVVRLDTDCDQVMKTPKVLVLKLLLTALNSADIIFYLDDTSRGAVLVVAEYADLLSATLPIPNEGVLSYRKA
jgi:hypothetical protein